MTTPSSKTDFQIALEQMSPALMSAALAAGADPDGQVHFGRGDFPMTRDGLWAALVSGRPESLEVSRLLIEAGARLDKTFIGLGSNAVSTACGDGASFPLEKIELLLSRGADVNALSLDGSCAAHSACWRSIEQDRDSSPALLRSLASAGADLARKNRNGDTPMDFAIANNNRPAIGALWDLGQRVNEKKWTGRFAKTPQSCPQWPGLQELLRSLSERVALERHIEDDSSKTPPPRAGRQSL